MPHIRCWESQSVILSIVPTYAPRSAALFDVDGTLVDSIPMIVAGLTESFRHFAVIDLPEREIRSLIGMPLRDQLMLYGLQDHPTPLEERVSWTIDAYSRNVHLMSEFGPAVEAFDRLVELGVPVALVTSRNRQEVEWLLEREPRFSAAQAVVSASDTERPKPAADPVLEACRRLGVQPEEAIFIGDSLHDLGSAQAASCPFLAVTYGSATRPDFIAHGADLLVDTPEELRTWIENRHELDLWQTKTKSLR